MACVYVFECVRAYVCVCVCEVLGNGIPEVELDAGVLPEMSSCSSVRSTTGIEP